MPSNPIGFRITNATAGFSRADFDDVFVRKDCFLEGGLWVWGAGYANGDNTSANRSSPVQTISGGTNWKEISIGGSTIGLSYNRFTTAIKSDGTLWAWGNNACGSLGDNTAANKSSPVQTISGGNNWKQVSAGLRRTSAIKTDGTLWNWGFGYGGALGNNSTSNAYSPVQTISGGNNWKQVSAGGYHVAAIKTDGTLWTWGFNSYAQLGDNTRLNKSSPVQTISGGNNWKQVSAGGSHNAAIKTDGSLWLWGRQQRGQLGNNISCNSGVSSPIQTVSGGTNWKQVDASGLTVGAIKTDGTLWLWGAGSSGVLGQNDTIDRSSPVQTISGGTNWRQVSMGYIHSAAIKTDGTLWTWGRNDFAQLGNNTAGINNSRSSPVQTITGGTNWRKVSAGYWNTGGIREDCW